MGLEKYAARDIRAAKEKITDEQIFLSNGYRELLRTVTIGATKEFSGYTYNVKVIPHAEYAAVSSADALTRIISINLSNDFIKQAGARDKKHEVILGILLHEIGHLLYTDFGELETAITNLSNGNLLYEDICNEDLVNLLSGGKRLRMMLIKIYKHYSNCVEDGYIENRLLDTFPGYGECLLTLRNMQMTGDVANMEKESSDDACLADLMNLTLEYAKYGIDYSRYKSKTAQEYFAKLKPLINEALVADNRRKRNRLYAKGLLVFAEYLAKLSEEMQDKESDSMPSSPEDNTERNGEATRGDAADTDTDDGSEGEDDEKNSNDGTDESTDSLEIPSSTGDGTNEDSSSDAKKNDSEDDTEKDADPQGEGDDVAQGDETENAENDKAGGNDSADDEDPGTTGDGTGSDAESETSDEGAETETDEDSDESAENQDDNASESGNTENAETEGDDGESQPESSDGNGEGTDDTDKDTCEGEPENADSDGTEETSSDVSSDDSVDTDSFDESAPDGDANDEYGDGGTTDAEAGDKDADETEPVEDASRPKDAGDQPKRPESNIVPPELERLENEIAEDICRAEGHALVLKQMVKAAKKAKKDRSEYGFDSNRGCKCFIMEQTEAGQERYQLSHTNLDRIAGRTANALERVIKEREIDGFTNEQYEGAYLDMANLYRDDKRILQDKNVPEGRPDMEAVVLVDCSGSMSTGSRMESARDCAYITWKFCQGVGIPCSVYGHTTTWDGPEPLTLSCAAHKTDRKEKGERILSLEAFSDNVDDFAIRTCTELLKESRAKKKFLFIISDGVPMANNRYHGIHANNMTRWAVEDAKRAGIGVITAGLGESCEQVKEVYVKNGDQKNKHRARFLDCTDVDGLPKAFVGVLKEEIL